MSILPKGAAAAAWKLDERCDLTDLIRRDCSHCLGDTLGDEESSKIPFGGLLRKRGEIESGARE